MNPNRKDLLLVLLALAAILGCGFGMGRITGETDPAPVPPPQVSLGELETATLLSLRRALDLTPEQEALLRPEIEETTREVLRTREQAVHDFHVHMLQLHDRLAPHLEPRQQDILDENRSRLQDTIDLRFHSLLEDPSPDSD